MMMIEPIYYAVFFDVEKPRNYEYVMNKRINKQTFKSLSDGIEGKMVELKNNDETIHTYKIVAVSTFKIENTVDNHFFCICDVERISLGN